MFVVWPLSHGLEKTGLDYGTITNRLCNSQSVPFGTLLNSQKRKNRNSTDPGHVI